MSSFIELEINHLLSQTSDLTQVAHSLIGNLTSQPEHLTTENIEGLANFLLNAELNYTLIQFVNTITDIPEAQIPWAQFIEALANIQTELDDRFLKALRVGIQKQNSQMQASRTRKMDLFLPDLKTWRDEYEYSKHKKNKSEKEELMDQIVLLRTQQLFQREKEVLEKLHKIYPTDREVKKELADYRQRNALEILSRKSPKKSSTDFEKIAANDPDVQTALTALQQSMIEHAEQSPELAFDFAMLAFMLDDYEQALVMLNYANTTIALHWLRMELLLRTRRFVELLSAISHAELQYATDPETFFATAYYRAQALWGLGQKHTAIEVMRGLIAARPQYRAASALLSIWSEQ